MAGVNREIQTKLVRPGIVVGESKKDPSRKREYGKGKARFYARLVKSNWCSLSTCLSLRDAFPGGLWPKTVVIQVRDKINPNDASWSSQQKSRSPLLNRLPVQ